MLVLDSAMPGIRDLLPYEYLSLSYHNHTISLLLFLKNFFILLVFVFECTRLL